jgi:soluble lytic murein transglycosylase
MLTREFERRTGVIITGRKIRISELTGLIFIATISALLIVFTLQILHNEYTIHRHTRSIAAGRSERIIRSHQLEELRVRVEISELLCSLTGRNLAPGVLHQISDIVYRNSMQFGYDPVLLLAVIQVESVFKTTARGRYRDGTGSGAFGLMQVKPETAREIAAQLNMGAVEPDDLFKPEINVPIGVAYLTSMISRFRDFKLGLLAYNQGPAAVSRQLARRTPLSMNYYRKVLASYERLKERARLLADISPENTPCR